MPSQSKYKPWVGEKEWRERQELAESASRAAYLRWVKLQLDPKCRGCLKQLGLNDQGKLVDQGARGARCLSCQRKNR